MTEATPRPWSRTGGFISVHDVEGIAQVNNEANAQLIVKAVNAHDALVAELEAAVEYEGIDEENSQYGPEWWRMALAALKAAGKES